MEDELKMKLWLDDVRLPPEGWMWVKTAHEATMALNMFEVDTVSLDHDLGPDEAGTGYDVLNFIESQLVVGGIQPPRVIKIHTANPAAHKRMVAARSAILLRAGGGA